VTVLGAASALLALGYETVGWALGLLVAALALLAAATGLCVGCELYRLGARLRGIRERHIDRVDLGDLGEVTAHGEGELVVQFTHPLCSDCHELEARLAAGPQPLHTVDVSRRPDLARRYHVAVVPAAFRVAGDGTVLERLA
jgi:hypothetical protein